MNAIDTQLSRALDAVFHSLAADELVDGVVLAGKPDCFCAGLNVVTLATSAQAGLPEFIRAYLATLQAMVRFESPSWWPSPPLHRPEERSWPLPPTTA